MTSAVSASVISSADVRARVGHPVIDADGHILELMPLAVDHLEKALGADLFKHYQDRGPIMRRNQAQRSLDERRRTRAPQGAWWGTHTVNVRDRATAMLPGLLYERMDEIGIDVSGHTPNAIADLYDTSFDLVISLSPEAHHQALEMTRTMAVDVEYWPTLDPSLQQGNRDQRLDAYRALRDQLFRRIKQRFHLEGAPVV